MKNPKQVGIAEKGASIQIKYGNQSESIKTQ